MGGWVGGLSSSNFPCNSGQNPKQNTPAGTPRYRPTNPNFIACYFPRYSFSIYRVRNVPQIERGEFGVYRPLRLILHHEGLFDYVTSKIPPRAKFVFFANIMFCCRFA